MPTLKLRNKSYNVNKIPALTFNFIFWEILHPLYRTPSRLIFGNSIGFRQNFFPKVNFFIRNLNYSGTKDPELRDKLKKFREKGYMKLERFDKELTNQAVKEFNDCVKNPKIGIKKQTHLDMPPIYISNASTNIPSTKSFLTADLDKFLKEYFCGNYKVISVRAWRNHSSDTSNPHADIGISNAFHYDGVPNNILQLFILLSDGVNKNTGATKILDIKNSKKISRKLLNFSRNYIPKSILDEIMSKIEYLSGDSGDAYLFNSQECLHGAGVPINGSFRNLLTLAFQSCSENIDLKNKITSITKQDPNFNAYKN